MERPQADELEQARATTIRHLLNALSLHSEAVEAGRLDEAARHRARCRRLLAAARALQASIEESR
jgi:hypothetical protein